MHDANPNNVGTYRRLNNSCRYLSLLIVVSMVSVLLPTLISSFRPHYPITWNGSDGPYQQKPVKPPRGDGRIKPRASISNPPREQCSLIPSWHPTVGVCLVFGQESIQLGPASHWKLSNVKAPLFSSCFKPCPSGEGGCRCALTLKKRLYPGGVWWP